MEEGKREERGKKKIKKKGKIEDFRSNSSSGGKTQAERTGRHAYIGFPVQSWSDQGAWLRLCSRSAPILQCSCLPSSGLITKRDCFFAN